MPADLQSAPFGRSGNLARSRNCITDSNESTNLQVGADNYALLLSHTGHGNPG